MRYVAIFFMVIFLHASLVAAQEGTTVLCGNQCPDCGPRECKTQVARYVKTSAYAQIHNPPCEGMVPEEVRLAIHAIAAYFSGGESLKGYDAIDALIKTRREQVVKAIETVPQLGMGILGDILEGTSGYSESSCEVLTAVLPKYAQVTRIKLGMHNDTAGGAECPPNGGDCPQGFSGYEPPVEEGQIVWTIAKNWSNDRLNTANFRVYWTR